MPIDNDRWDATVGNIAEIKTQLKCVGEMKMILETMHNEHIECRKEVNRLNFQVFDEHDCSRVVEHATRLGKLENEVFFDDGGRQASRVEANTIRLEGVEQRHNFAVRITIPVVTAALIALMSFIVKLTYDAYTHIESAKIAFQGLRK